MTNPSGPPTAFDSLTVAGVPTIGGGGIPLTFGNYWFVDPVYGSDGYNGQSMQSAFKTLAFALTKVVDNNDDVVLLRGSSTVHTLTSMLTVTKSRTHFVGLDGAWRPYGPGAHVVFAGTSGASNIAAMKNTGVRNTFTNIKFDQGSTITQCIYAVAEGGEYTQYTNCEFYMSSNLNTTAAAEFVWNGDSTIMENCTIGSLADPLVGSIIRPCVLVTKDTTGTGLVCRDGLMRNTRLWRNASATTNAFVYGANAADVERTLTMEHVGFINNGASAFKPAQCVEFAASLTVGQVVVDPTCYASNVTKLSTTTGVIVTGAAPNSGTGIGVNAA